MEDNVKPSKLEVGVEPPSKAVKVSHEKSEAEIDLNDNGRSSETKSDKTGHDTDAIDGQNNDSGAVYYGFSVESGIDFSQLSFKPQKMCTREILVSAPIGVRDDIQAVLFSLIYGGESPLWNHFDKVISYYKDKPDAKGGLPVPIHEFLSKKKQETVVAVKSAFSVNQKSRGALFDKVRESKDLKIFVFVSFSNIIIFYMGKTEENAYYINDVILVAMDKQISMDKANALFHVLRYIDYSIEKKDICQFIRLNLLFLPEDRPGNK